MFPSKVTLAWGHMAWKPSEISQQERVVLQKGLWWGTRKYGLDTWPMSHHRMSCKRAWTKWHELICENCLRLGSVNKRSTCQRAVVFLKATNSPLFHHVSGTRPPLLQSTLPPIISPLNDTATPQINSMGVEKNVSFVVGTKGEKKESGTVDRGRAKALGFWQMVMTTCLYCLCLNKQLYYKRVCIVLQAICHWCFS